MKHNIVSRISLALASGFLCFQPQVNAANPADASNLQAALRQRIQEVNKQLNLTQEQKAQLRPIFLAEMQKVRALREDNSLLPRQKLQKLKAMQEEMVPKVKAILTPDQFKQWQEMREETREKIREDIREKIQNRFKK